MRRVDGEKNGEVGGETSEVTSHVNVAIDADNGINAAVERWDTITKRFPGLGRNLHLRNAATTKRQ